MTKVIIISTDNFEDLELFFPLHRLKEENIDVEIASIKKGLIVGKHGYHAHVDLTLTDTDPEKYDMLILPGGRAPETIRLDAKALEIVRHFFNENKPVGAICHGIQILISAKVVWLRKATCYIGIRDDLILAGAEYEDKEVVVDGNLVTSRSPDDLYAFGRELVKKLR